MKSGHKNIVSDFMRISAKALFLITIIILASCKSMEKVAYMQDIPATDSTFILRQVQNIKIQSGDKISILVNTSIPELANQFNLAVPYRYIGGSMNSSSQSVSLYTVDTDGDIDFPILGKQHVAGKTRQEISDQIKNAIISQNYLKDAVVNVDYGNLTFSVMGEVNSAGRYSFDKDHITLLEALAMARDLTITGRRDNVLVMRQEADGTQHTYRVDLRDSKSLCNSPAFNIQQNDVIYVQPNETKSRQSTINGNNVLSTSFWVSIASLACTVAALLIR